jgi:hypothetical protein
MVAGPTTALIASPAFLRLGGAKRPLFNNMLIRPELALAINKMTETNDNFILMNRWWFFSVLLVTHALEKTSKCENWKIIGMEKLNKQ